MTHITLPLNLTEMSIAKRKALLTACLGSLSESAVVTLLLGELTHNQMAVMFNRYFQNKETRR